MNDNKQQQQQRKTRRRRESTNDAVTGGDEEKDEKKVKTRGLNEIITSLILLDDQEKTDIEELDVASHDEKLQLDENYSKRTRAMMDYYSKLQEYHGDADRVDDTRKRKSKTNAFAATNAAAMAIGAASAEDSDQTGAVSDKPPSAGPQRRLWVKNRSRDWWDQCNSPDFPDEEFKRAFRMGKDTFDLICNELSSVVAKENTMLRDAVPVRQRVAVCIWRLATGEPLRLVSKKFGLTCDGLHNFFWKECRLDEFPVEPEEIQASPHLDMEDENHELLSQSRLEQRAEVNEWMASIANAMWEMWLMHNGDENEEGGNEDQNNEDEINE
ncbi:hypothetical protein OROMI_027951 [Orobanche minor]